MIILYGENIVLSRLRLTEISKSFPGEVSRFDVKEIDLTKLKQSLESKSLFGNDRLVVVENFFSMPSSKAKDNLLVYLKNSQSAPVILWDGKNIDGRVLTGFKEAKIEKFDLSSYIFKFLDSLAPQNSRQSLMIFHLCLEHDPAEIVFFMLTRQFRLLLIAKDLGFNGLEKMADWQKAKLVAQAKRFTLEKLISIYRQLLKIDYEQKTGKSPINLISQLDLLLADI